MATQRPARRLRAVQDDRVEPVAIEVQERTSSGLVVHYQPIVELPSLHVVGVEALMRRRHRGELLLPGQFLADAEATGALVALGRELFATAVACARRWHEAGGRDVQLMVNMSPTELLAPGQVEYLDRVLGRAGVRPRAVTLEITEHTPLPPGADLATRLHDLVDLGVGLALDDFGTGFGALQHMRDLPITGVKIDGRFVSGTGAVFDRAVVTAIGALASARRVWCVAEGIETVEQQTAVEASGVTFGQGHLYGRPVDAHLLMQRFWPQAVND